MACGGRLDGATHWQDLLGDAASSSAPISPSRERFAVYWFCLPGGEIGGNAC